MNCSVYYLTDLHFKKDSLPNDDVINGIADVVKDDENRKIVFVIGGDLSFSGQVSEFGVFEAFCLLVKEKTNKDIEFVITPGNHDILYNKNEEYTLEQLNKDLADGNYQQRLDKMANYYSFKRSFCKCEELSPTLDKYTFSCDCGNNLIVFSLNNVLFSCFGTTNSSDAAYGKIQTLFEDIKKIKKENENEFVILDMHFPLSFYSINEQEKLRKQLLGNADILFAGHIHNQQTELLIDTSNLNYLIGFPFRENEFETKFNFIKVDLQKNISYSYTFGENCFICDQNFKQLKTNSFNKNALKLSLSKEYLENSSNINILDKKLKLDDIFVFPFLSEKKYNKLSNRDILIRDFSSFKYKCETNKLVIIYGDDLSGKTTLLHQLIKLFFKENKCPLFCKGEDLENANNLKSFLYKQVSNCYSSISESQSIIFRKENKNKRILLVDDFTYGDLKKLDECREIFDTIIVFSNSTENDVFNIQKEFLDDEIFECSIEPMYKTKRRELLFNIFKVLSNCEMKNNIDIERLMDESERIIKAVDSVDSTDPLSIIYVGIAVYDGNETFDNKMFSSVYQAKVLLSLETLNKSLNYNFDLKNLYQIVSSLSFELYRFGKLNFHSNDIENSIYKHTDIYGDCGIKTKSLVNILVKSLIITEGDDGSLHFTNRDIFAFFVAEYIFDQMNDEDDKTAFELVLENGVLLPLNFSILMCICSKYNNTKITRNIIRIIDEQFKNEKLFNFNRVIDQGIGKSKINELKLLTKDDIDRINESESKNESQKRKKYLENKNNFYYQPTMPEDIQTIQLWTNYLKICCSLLRNFSSKLKIEEKDKLVNLVLNIPNVIINSFDEGLFKALDGFYAAISAEQGLKTNSQLLEKLNEEIINIKRAFILTAYDYGGRSFINNACIKLLRGKIKDTNPSEKDDLQTIQELMLMSFTTHDENGFISKCSNIIKNKENDPNSFLVISAKLIGRQFISRNYEYTNLKARDFSNLIFKKDKALLFKEQFKSK